MGCRGCRRRLSPICCPASAPVVAHEEISITSIPCLLGVMWERVLTMMLRDCWLPWAPWETHPRWPPDVRSGSMLSIKALGVAPNGDSVC